MSTDPTIKDFEGAIAELESVVKKLEEGDLSLEASLGLYERGVRLSRFCHEKLEEVERRIDSALSAFPIERLWINPDCGLKTRGWPETEAALVHMVNAARQLRKEWA